MTIRRAILKALDRQHPALVPQSTLSADVGMILGHEPLPSQIEAAIRELDAAKEITGRENREIGWRWKITDLGMVNLAEL